MPSFKERGIFEYDNGEKTLYGDPIVLLNKLTKGGLSEFDRLAKEALAGDMEAMETMASRVVTAFKLVPYNDETGVGLNSVEAFRVFEKFFVFIDELKNVLGPMPICEPSTEASGLSTATTSTSDSTSTEIEKCSETPLPPHLELESHLGAT